MEFSRVSRSDRRHWGSDMKNALRVGSFPIEDTQNREIKHGENEVPAVSFHEGANFFRRSLNEEVKSFILQCNTSKQSSERRSQKRKLSTSPCRIKEMAFGPDRRCWPQKLNFVFWCVTSECGISRETFELVDDSKMKCFWFFTSISQIIIMTCHRSNEALQNLEFHRARTSLSKKEMITPSVSFHFCD